MPFFSVSLSNRAASIRQRPPHGGCVHFRLRQPHMPEPQGFVRIEPNLLEHRHQGRYADFAQRRQPAVLLFLFFLVQQGERHVQVRVGVVPHVHAADERFAGIEIQLFHLILLRLVHVNRVSCSSIGTV